MQANSNSPKIAPLTNSVRNEKKRIITLLEHGKKKVKDRRRQGNFKIFSFIVWFKRKEDRMLSTNGYKKINKKDSSSQVQSTVQLSSFHFLHFSS